MLYCERMKKLRSLGCLALIVLLLAVSLVLYPNPTFSHKLRYKTVTVYANHPIDSEITVILEAAVQLVTKSDLADSNYTYDIFFNEDSWYKSYTQTLLGPALARAIDNNILLNAPVHIRENYIGAAGNKRDLVRTIAHEMVHGLQVNKYGMLHMNPSSHPPVWKLEGYPEYVSQRDLIKQPGYDFSQTAQRLKTFIEEGRTWVELTPEYGDPLIYFKGRVLMEFLIDHKKMSLDQVMEEQITEVEVYNEMLEFLRQTK